MMETDGRDSAKCQNWGKKGHRCHLKILNEEKTKLQIVLSSQIVKGAKNVGRTRNWFSSWRFHFLE